jgi:hypothetical protein
MRQKTLHSGPKEQAAEMLSFHPLAAKYGGNLDEKELDALARDIETNGQRFPIVVHNGQILDGVQRCRACQQLNKEPKAVPYDAEMHGGEDKDIEAFIISANIHRRHNTKRKREFIAALLKADPTKSNRQVAKEAGSNHHTVKRVRAKEERRGTVSHVEKRKDSKGRNQSASKPSKGRLPVPLPMAVGAAAPERDAPAPISNGAWWDQDPGKIAAQMVEHMPSKKVLSVLGLASDMLKAKQANAAKSKHMTAH